MKVRYLDYYKKNKLIPTLNLGDINEKLLKKQRFNFYFKLGLLPNEFIDKSILELCPGTGYNAYYLLKFCKIKNITLVEKNLRSLKVLEKNLKKYKNKKIFKKNIYDFKTKKKYDIVIIENTLPGLDSPQKILLNIFKYTKPGGSLVFTMSNIQGLFSEKLRYLYSVCLIQQNNILGYEKRLKFLTKLFKKHLRYLSPNTRKVRNWVEDNILHIEWIRSKKYFDLLDVLKYLKFQCYVRSVAPNFSKDFIWYKNMDITNHIENIKKNYLGEQINFVDFQTQFSKNEKNFDLIHQFNKELKKFSLEISRINFDKKITIKQINKLYLLIFKISKILNNLQVNNKITLALNDFLEFLSKFKKKEKKAIIRGNHFHKFWGIGTFAISLYKK